MLEMGETPVGVWADLLEEAGEETADLRAWLEWGVTAATGRYVTFALLDLHENGLGAGYWNGDGFQHAPWRGDGDAVGQGSGGGTERSGGATRETLYGHGDGGARGYTDHYDEAAQGCGGARN